MCISHLHYKQRDTKGRKENEAKRSDINIIGVESR